MPDVQSHPIMDAIFGGLKQVGEAGVDAAKTVAQLPLTIATLPTDFLKDPSVFFGNGPRGVDIGAILSKDYRKQKAADIQGARDFEKMKQHAGAVKFVQDLFSGDATDTAQGEHRKALVAQGFDPAMLQPFANAAKAERHAARKGANASGLLPEVANIADVDSAQKAGQAQLSDRFQKEQIGAQGEETRQNQASQFGYTVAAQNNSAGNTAQNIRLRDQLAQRRASMKAVEPNADSAFVANVLADPVLAADPEALPLKTRDTLAIAAKSGGLAAKMAAKRTFEQLTGGTIAHSGLQKLMGNEFGRNLLKASQGKTMTLNSLDSMEQFRSAPNLFAAGAGAQQAVESGAEKVFGRKPSQFAERRTALEQAAGTFTASYMQSISGATIPEAEVERLRKNVPNLDVDSYSTFFVKLDAMKAAQSRDKELLEAQMKAVVADDLEQFQKISVQRGAEASRLADQLERLSPIPDEDLQYLTPEERQSLGR